MDAAQWPQGIGAVRRVDETESSRINSEKKKARPEKEEAAAALNCPRCNSTNTKFCYYNNYSLSQPRYFCKSCRRYWTAGGTLRNVPVGGTSRKKNKTSSYNSSSPSISTQKSIPDLSPPKVSPQNPKIHDGRDLYLSYNDPPLCSGISDLLALPLPHNLNLQNPNLDLFRTGGLSSLVSGPVSNSNSLISSGFQLGFSLENRFGNSQAAVQDEPAAFEETGVVANYEFEHRIDRGLQRDSNGFWSGMLSGDSW